MSLFSKVSKGDWTAVRRNFRKIGSSVLGPNSSVIFNDLTLNALTASKLIASDANKKLVSSDLINWVTGTANEIDIADDGDGTITIGIVNPLIVGKGGTGAATLTDHGILLGSGTGAVTPLGVAGDGYIPIGSTGADPVLALITGTANQITSTPGAGTITLSTPQDIHTAATPTFAGAIFTAVVTGVFPTEGAHLATKEYVDAALGTRKEFFLSDTASIVGALNLAYPIETGGVQSSIISAALGLGDAQFIKGYITEAGEPGTITVRKGVYSFHFHAKKGAANQRIAQLYFVLSRVDADGTSNKTTIATSEASTALTEVELSYNVHAALGTDVEVAITSRLILDVYANIGAGAQPAVVTLYMEGTEDSYFSIETASEVFQTHGDVLDDLNILGANAADSEFLVGTGAGAFAWESGTTVRTSLGLGTGDSPQFTGIELGHATDTTLTRASAGNLNIEGNIVYRAGGTDVPIGDGGTGQGTAQAAIDALSAVSDATNEHVLTKDTASGNAIWKAGGGGGANELIGITHDCGTSDISLDEDISFGGGDSGGEHPTEFGVITIGDGSLTKTSAAPTTDAMIANKKYVDDQIAAFGEYATDDDDSQAMAAAHAYLANQNGFVTVIFTAVLQGTVTVTGYVDTDNNPAAGGVVMGASLSSTYPQIGDKDSFMFPVQSGKYFEITASNATVVIVWTPFGTLVKCTDQD